jgi:hypothetical protein
VLKTCHKDEEAPGDTDQVQHVHNLTQNTDVGAAGKNQHKSEPRRCQRHVPPGPVLLLTRNLALAQENSQSRRIKSIVKFQLLKS